jgi:hypothetical protein
MPSLKRGFLFRYFDKIICGVIGLGLLLGIAYALSRASSLPPEIMPETVNSLVARIQTKLRAPAKALTAQVPTTVALTQVPDAPAVRNDMFVWPMPVEYAPIKVGLNKEFVLQFRAPLGEGTVSVQGAAPIIELIEHPVGGDYSKVKLVSKGYEGQAQVVGYEGRIAHVYPVIVDASVNKTAYPPTLTVASQQGTVTLNLVEDPKIAEKGVDVAYYEIWRRTWSDPLGKYELADEVDRNGRSLRAAQPGRPGAAPAIGAPAGMPPAVMPGMPPGTTFTPPGMVLPGVPPTLTAPRRPGATGTEAAGITWRDKDVDPGDQYSYKARTVGTNTFPTEGEYCQPVVAEVLPDIDFKFTLTSQDSVRFEVVKAVGPAGATKENFWVGIGDAIGGIQTDKATGATESYLPGYVLVDFHPVATEPGKPGLTSRVIYSDDKGNLRVLWRNETKADALWDREKASSATPATRTPFGPFGPGVPVPGR